jgi:ferric-dicitrate binding protein FerR (iron transport regulator)
MLYEMLTGRLPYVGADWEERLRAKRQCAPTPPSVHRPELAPALEAVVLRAIAPELDDRYASAEELLAALRDPPSALLAPVGASPPRHRLDLRLAAAIAAIVAALAVVGGVAWLGHQRGLEAPASVGPQRDVRR